MRHSVLSPSSSHRWLVCPGSVEANRGKKHTDNFYSLEGTTAHALLEVCLRLGADPFHLVGRLLEHGHMPIDEAMADGVGHALDYVTAYLANNPNARVLPEQEVHYGRQIGIDEDEDPDDTMAFGTSDLILDNYPKEVVSLDYKHGVGIPVSVKENTQLRMYLLGMRQERGRYQRYRSVVVQPRLPRRKPVQEAVMRDAELTGWVNRVVIPVVPVALRKNAPRVAGEHCRYCAADGNCRAQLEKVQQLAADEFKTADDPKSLTPAEIAKLLDVLGTLTSIADAVKKRAVAAVHAGVKIPGYQQAWTASRRIWKDEEEANVLLERLGLQPKERFKVELLSPAQAEDALKGKKLWPKKQRGVKEQMTPLDEALAFTDGNPTIEKAHPKA